MLKMDIVGLFEIKIKNKKIRVEEKNNTNIKLHSRNCVFYLPLVFLKVRPKQN